jgi:hypothetical protein
MEKTLAPDLIALPGWLAFGLVDLARDQGRQAATRLGCGGHEHPRPSPPILRHPELGQSLHANLLRQSWDSNVRAHREVRDQVVSNEC